MKKYELQKAVELLKRCAPRRCMLTKDEFEIVEKEFLDFCEGTNIKPQDIHKEYEDKTWNDIKACNNMIPWK